MEPLRINRFLARCGLGSRRAVESLVREGRVRVNDAAVTDLSRRVDPDRDRVTVDGKPVQPVAVGTVLVLHKPVGVVSSLVRQDQRPCVADLLGPEWAGRHLFHVGRLDHDSSGVLLLSDDGDLAHSLLHPSRPVWKVYRIEVRPALDSATWPRLADGSLVLDGRPVAPARVRPLDDHDRATRLEVELREGRNRQLRRMVELLGSRVVRLHRIAFGPVRLGDLPAGGVRPVTAEEDRELRGLGAR